MNAAMAVERPLVWCVALTACLAPWAFGAVDPSWAAALAAGCLVPTAAVLILDAVSRRAVVLPRDVLVAVVAVMLVPALGLVPLPDAVRGFLAPGGTAILREVDPASAGELRPTSFAPASTRAALALAAAYCGAFLLFAREAGRPSGRRVLTALLALTGVALAVFGVVQHAQHAGETQPKIYGVVPIYEAGTPYGPYVNRTHFAGAMALLTCVCAGECAALWSERRRIVAALYGASAVVTLGALAATTARGGVLGVAAAGAFVLSAVPSGRRLRVALLICALAAAAAAVLFWSGALDQFLGRIGTLYGRWASRFGVQRDALGAFLANPVAGTGAGSFSGAYAPYQRVFDERTFANAHSDWAQILMETGLLGVTAVVLVARVFVRSVRSAAAVGADGADGARRWRVLGPAAGVIAIAAHGFVDVNLHIPANALLTVCALSLASAAATGADAEPSQPKRAT